MENDEDVIRRNANRTKVLNYSLIKRTLRFKSAASKECYFDKGEILGFAWGDVKVFRLVLNEPNLSITLRHFQSLPLRKINGFNDSLHLIRQPTHSDFNLCEWHSLLCDQHGCDCGA